MRAYGADVLDVLRDETDALAAATNSLDEDEFDTPTGCEPWTVKELLAHLLVACQRVPGMLDGPAPDRAEVSARAYFSGDKLGGTFDAERIATAQQDAAIFGSGRDLVAAVLSAVEETVSRAAAEPEDRLVFTRWGEPMELHEYLKTRVFELVVHGIDLAMALGLPAWTTPPAAAVTIDVLCDGGPRPDVGWDDVTFIAKATGRSPVTREEVAGPARGTLLWPQISSGDP